MLVEAPHLGRPAGIQRHGVLRYPHAGHIIYYQVETPNIFVVRVLHHSMDSERHLDT